jgi:hypothetical protein
MKMVHEEGTAGGPNPRGYVERKDGRRLRRFTIYLDPSLARRLVLYCADRDQELSGVVAAALEGHLLEADDPRR